jgi:hypothetical protein
MSLLEVTTAWMIMMSYECSRREDYEMEKIGVRRSFSRCDLSE